MYGRYVHIILKPFVYSQINNSRRIDECAFNYWQWCVHINSFHVLLISWWERPT